MKEQEKFKGCCTCVPPCTEVFLTGEGARDFHEELCRLKGMSADQLIRSWKKENPDDEW